MEIFYKVHSFAIKRLEVIRKTLLHQTENDKTSEQINEAKHQLNAILAWMNVFKHYGVANRGPNGKSSEGFYNEPMISTSYDDESPNIPTLKAINQVTNRLIWIVDSQQKIEECCINAFEGMLKRT